MWHEKASDRVEDSFSDYFRPGESRDSVGFALPLSEISIDPFLRP